MTLASFLHIHAIGIDLDQLGDDVRARRHCMRRLIALFVLTLAACAAPADEGQRFPVSSDYPPGVMEHAAYTAPNGWRISTLQTPERPDATWKIVILTGTPSWNEYW